MSRNKDAGDFMLQEYDTIALSFSKMQIKPRKSKPGGSEA